MTHNKMNNFAKPFLALGVAVILSTLLSTTAEAIPLFARQVQQNCVACHVGGQYPELTPYGRYFKLTGYTQGDQQWDPAKGIFPVAMSVQAGSNTMKNNKSNGSDGSDPAAIDNRNGNFKIDQVSVYAGGKITDNLGLFAQYSFYYNLNSANQNNAVFGADNFDLRYADHYSNGYKDIIFGTSLNNNPGVTDVFNSTPAYFYPYQISSTASGALPPYLTQIESYGGGSARGVNGYVYINRNWYAEVGGYTANTGATKFMSWINDGSKNPSSNPTRNSTTNLVGVNPYYRLAATKEWGAHNIMVGAFGMNSKIADFSTLGLPDATGTNVPIASGTPAVMYQDRGLDSQYQYISSPHVVSAQLRYVQESINDATGLAYANQFNNMYSRYAKISYIYNAKYGANLAYWSITGSSDSTKYPSGTGGDPSLPAPKSANLASATNSPNSNAWIPSIFWQPLQNMRLSLTQTYWTKFAGAKQNYDGYGRNASDNNTTYLWLWLAY